MVYKLGVKLCPLFVWTAWLASCTGHHSTSHVAQARPISPDAPGLLSVANTRQVKLFEETEAKLSSTKSDYEHRIGQFERIDGRFVDRAIRQAQSVTTQAIDSAVEILDNTERLAVKLSAAHSKGWPEVFDSTRETCKSQGSRYQASDLVAHYLDALEICYGTADSSVNYVATGASTVPQPHVQSDPDHARVTIRPSGGEELQNTTPWTLTLQGGEP